MVKAVVFDMDGIMFDTENLTTGLWKKASEKLGCADATPYKGEFMGMNSVYHKKYFLKKFGAGFPYDEFIRCADEFTSEHIAKHGVPVKPGLFQLLEFLKQSGFLIAAALFICNTAKRCGWTEIIQLPFAAPKEGLHR